MCDVTCCGEVMASGAEERIGGSAKESTTRGRGFTQWQQTTLAPGDTCSSSEGVQVRSQGVSVGRVTWMRTRLTGRSSSRPRVPT